MQLQKADIVLSIAGHDKGKLFFCLETDGQTCLIASGKEGRTTNRPKRKSVKHLRFMDRFDCETAERLKNGQPVQNCELRRDLAKFRESQNNQGGK